MYLHVELQFAVPITTTGDRETREPCSVALLFPSLFQEAGDLCDETWTSLVLSPSVKAVPNTHAARCAGETGPEACCSPRISSCSF